MKVIVPVALLCVAASCCVSAAQALTAADFPGPDGLVYPDWTWAGVPGGIPDVPVRARLSEFGAKPDDDADDSAALQRAVDAVGAKGGALLIEAGTYHLDRPVIITRDNVVIRGEGPARTRLINRYGPPEAGVAFFLPRDGDQVNEDTWVEVHCQPDGLNAIRVQVDGKQVYSRTRSEHWGGTFSGKMAGSTLLGAGADGAHQLKAIAEFDNGKRAEATINVVFKRQPEGAPRARHMPSFLGAITFVGDSLMGPRLLLTADAERGDTALRLNSTEGLQRGDCIVLTAPATERWNNLVQNACKWGSYRRNEYRVEALEGNTIRINQPLRIPFPTIDESYVQKYRPIRRCGVEGLYLEQTQKLWTSAVIFSHAWECWARDVHVRKCGQWPVYTTPAKWCEIRDCRFDEAWYNGGGGTAYTGFQSAYDCLMENVHTTKMRHAPCVQWSASGNVIRNSTFIQSDGQWHAGWTNENLYEQCVIDAQQGTGAYGHGFWGSPPNDTAHGPNGPRNVVYNCDVTAPKNGIWMGGMNHGWLILYNRLLCGAGPGVFMQKNSDEHLIAHNVFVLKDGKSPGISIGTDDCDGVRAIGNAIYGGSGVLVAGKGNLAEATDNALKALPAEGTPDRPTAAVPSIFEWQQAQKARRTRN
jgi:hypothetical protein